MQTLDDKTTLSGSCEYYTNGSLICYDLYDQITDIGTYTITEGPQLCYEKECYTRPKDFPCTCTSYFINENDGYWTEQGCLVFGNDCQPPTNCTSYWNNWESSRLIKYL